MDFVIVTFLICSFRLLNKYSVWSFTVYWMYSNKVATTTSGFCQNFSCDFCCWFQCKRCRSDHHLRHHYRHHQQPNAHFFGLEGHAHFNLLVSFVFYSSRSISKMQVLGCAKRVSFAEERACGRDSVIIVLWIGCNYLVWLRESENKPDLKKWCIDGRAKIKCENHQPQARIDTAIYTPHIYRKPPPNFSACRNESMSWNATKSTRNLEYVTPTIFSTRIQKEKWNIMKIGHIFTFFSAFVSFRYLLHRSTRKRCNDWNVCMP